MTPLTPPQSSDGLPLLSLLHRSPTVPGTKLTRSVSRFEQAHSLPTQLTAQQQQQQQQQQRGQPGPDPLFSDEIKSEVKRVVPALDGNSWKGQAGKVGVVGGSLSSTGPPFWVAMACLKLGADLSHVFTTKAAAAVIRTYSPDLLVHSSFVDSCECSPEQLQGSGREALVQAGCAEVEAWFSRLDCLVLGPGLGRDPLLLDIGQNLVEAARKVGLPLVLDGDGLLLAARAPEVVRGYSTCVMTPNLNEFRRLSVTLGVSLHGPNSDRLSKLRDVTQLLAGPVLLSKGPTDAIHDGQHPVLCSASGGLRRCRGQGDILSGAVAVFVCWTRAFITRARAGHDTAALLDMNPMMLAAFGASLITRGACHQAFSLKQRAMLAGDVMEQLGGALEALMQSQAGPGPTPRAGTAFKPLDS